MFMNIVLVVVVVLKLASRHYQLHFLQINTKTLWIFESSCKFIIGVACVVCRLINLSMARVYIAILGCIGLI